MYCGTGPPSPFVSKNGARYHINSGYTPYDREWGVGSRPWGNVELLTLTLSFPCNRKRYQLGGGGFMRLLVVGNYCG